MLQHVVDELNASRDATITNLLNIYSDLSRKTSYSKYCYNLFDSDLYEVFEYESLLDKKWGLEILSDHTFKLTSVQNKF